MSKAASDGLPEHWDVGRVLCRELEVVRGISPIPDRDPSGVRPSGIGVEEWAYRRCTALTVAEGFQPLSALCLSGGGIRSAAFSLGVIQALARKNLLSKFDYLSTVSGGGFIGSWLSTLIRLEDVSTVETMLQAETPGDPLGSLRGFTNYLTPQTGLFSIDTWSGIVLYLRNTLINWLVYLPILLGLVLSAIFYRTAIWIVGEGFWATCFVCLVATITLLVAVFFACSDLPSHRPEDRAYQSEAAIQQWIVVPALVWSFLVPVMLARDFSHGLSLPEMLAIPTGYLLILMAGYGFAAVWQARRGLDQSLFLRNIGWWLIASIFSSALLLLGIWVAEQVIDPMDAAKTIAVFAPLWLVAAHVLQSTIYVALRSEVRQADLDREWLGRLSAMLLRFALSWSVFSFACLILPTMVFSGLSHGLAWTLPMGGLLSGPVAAWIGKQVAGTASTSADKPARTERLLNLLLPLLAVIFVIALVTSVSALAGFVLGNLQDRIAEAAAWPRFGWNDYFGQWLAADPDQVFDATAVSAQDVTWSWHDREIHSQGLAALGTTIWFWQWRWLPVILQTVGFVTLGTILAVVARRINVNRFSMHAVYRNRLARAFLGTAREAARNPDPFTGFDPEDTDLRLKDFCRSKLFPVINMTLNLTRQTRTAWSERKAASFFATPLACGSAALDRRERGAMEYGFVPTHAYAGMEHRDSSEMESLGLTLGTAMTISGAAVSPNWGYHSSPLTAFLMTLFNARLGAWLPNPAKVFRAADLAVAMPPDGNLAAVKGDLLGQTTDSSQAIYLSDGGHFENLGLYEMLRRRCLHIVVVDASQDQRDKFADLGNAIRKAYIDMQISVVIDLPIGSARQPPSIADIGVSKDNPDAAFVMGSILYPEGQSGSLIYLKPGWLKEMPADVRVYGAANPDFPNQTTGDQWFSESQFESYRQLGFFQGLRMTANVPDQGGLAELFRAVA